MEEGHFHPLSTLLPSSTGWMHVTHACWLCLCKMSDCLSASAPFQPQFYLGKAEFPLLCSLTPRQSPQPKGKPLTRTNNLNQPWTTTWSIQLHIQDLYFPLSCTKLDPKSLWKTAALRFGSKYYTWTSPPLPHPPIFLLAFNILKTNRT